MYTIYALVDPRDYTVPFTMWDKQPMYTNGLVSMLVVRDEASFLLVRHFVTNNLVEY